VAANAQKALNSFYDKLSLGGVFSVKAGALGDSGNATDVTVRLPFDCRVGNIEFVDMWNLVEFAETVRASNGLILLSNIMISLTYLQLTRTLKTRFTALVGAVPNFLFTAVAVIHLMLAFTVVAVLLFGSSVRSFATFESAMLALFFMLIGRASTSQELAAYSDESGNPLAVLYLFVFTVVLVFVTSASVISTITEAWSDSTELLTRHRLRAQELKKLEDVQKQADEYATLKEKLQDVSDQDIELLAEIVTAEAQAAMADAGKPSALKGGDGGDGDNGGRAPTKKDTIESRHLVTSTGDVRSRRAALKEKKGGTEGILGLGANAFAGLVSATGLGANDLVGEIMPSVRKDKASNDAAAVYSAMNVSETTSGGASTGLASMAELEGLAQAITTGDRNSILADAESTGRRSAKTVLAQQMQAIRGVIDADSKLLSVKAQTEALASAMSGAVTEAGGGVAGALGGVKTGLGAMANAGRSTGKSVTQCFGSAGDAVTCNLEAVMTGNLEKVTGNLGAAAGAVTGNLGAAAGNLGAVVGLPKFAATSRRTEYEEISDATREKAEHMLEIAQVAASTCEVGGAPATSRRRKGQRSQSKSYGTGANGETLEEFEFHDEAHAYSYEGEP